MKSSFSTVVALILTLGGTAMADTTVVTKLLPLSSPPVVGSWYLSDVRPGGSASLVDLTGLGGNLENNQPLPTGAVKLTTDFTVEAKAEVGTYGDFGLASAVMNDIVLGYSYYKQYVDGGNAAAAPALRLILQADGGTGDNYGALVYEPYWNLPSMNVPTNAWQSVNITNSTGAGSDGGGGWWWDGGFEIANSSGGPPLRSLSEWVAAFQVSDPTDFASAHVVGVSVGVGTYNMGQIGYFDNVSIQSTAGSVDAVYNFEVPEPGTLAMMFAGGLAALTVAMIRRRRSGYFRT